LDAIKEILIIFFGKEISPNIKKFLYIKIKFYILKIFILQIYYYLNKKKHEKSFDKKIHINLK
jgi:hypothetical protein